MHMLYRADEGISPPTKSCCAIVHTAHSIFISTTAVGGSWRESTIKGKTKRKNRKPWPCLHTIAFVPFQANYRPDFDWKGGKNSLNSLNSLNSFSSPASSCKKSGTQQAHTTHHITHKDGRPIDRNMAITGTCVFYSSTTAGEAHKQQLGAFCLKNAIPTCL